MFANYEPLYSLS